MSSRSTSPVRENELYFVDAASASTIFVIDDDDIVRDSLKVLLETRNFAVQDFNSGGDFLRRRGGSRADCLILDVHMPQMTGLELLKLLCDRGEAIPAVLITGRSDTAVQAQAKALGVVVLEKPVSFPTLLAAVQQATATRRH